MSDFKTPQGGEQQVTPVVDHETEYYHSSSVQPNKGDISRPYETATTRDGASPNQGHGHGAVELVGADPAAQPPIQTTVAELDRSKGRFGYLKKRQFWIVLLLSQALAVTITGTNTLSSLLRDEGTSIPAFQSLFNVGCDILCWTLLMLTIQSTFC